MPAATERVLKLRQDPAHADFLTGIRGLSAKALRERSGPIVKEIRALSDALDANPVEADGSRQFTAEQEAKWVLVNGQYDLLKQAVDDASDPLHSTNARDRAAELEASLKTPISDKIGVGMLGNGNPPAGGDGASLMETEKLRTLAYAGWFRAQMRQPITEDMERACRIMGMHPWQGELNVACWDTPTIRGAQEKIRGVHHTKAKEALRDYRADLSSLQGSQGAYTVPPETLMRQLEINMLWYGGMRQVADTIVTATGERMSWPTVDDTANTGVQLEESVAMMQNVTGGSPASVDPTFAKVYWDAYKFSSQPVLIPFELLQDSIFNLPAIIGELLGIRLGRITNTKYTIGTGAATAKGILVAGALGVTAASATAIAADETINLYHSVDPAYRQLGDIGYMMHDQILLFLRKFKDGMGRYLWSDGLQYAAPDRLNNCPIQINQDMPSTMASGNKTLVFGRLGNYKIRRVQGIRMYRLQERYRDIDKDAFIALVREDGNLLTAGTNPVKYLQH